MQVADIVVGLIAGEVRTEFDGRLTNGDLGGRVGGRDVDVLRDLAGLRNFGDAVVGIRGEIVAAAAGQGTAGVVGLALVVGETGLGAVGPIEDLGRRIAAGASADILEAGIGDQIHIEICRVSSTGRHQSAGYKTCRQGSSPVGNFHRWVLRVNKLNDESGRCSNLKPLCGHARWAARRRTGNASSSADTISTSDDGSGTPASMAANEPGPLAASYRTLNATKSA